MKKKEEEEEKFQTQKEIFRIKKKTQGRRIFYIGINFKFGTKMFSAIRCTEKNRKRP